MVRSEIKGIKLPDEYVDGLMQRSGQEDMSKFETARYLVVRWEEYKEVITSNLADENGWDKMDYDTAHRWFIEASAGESGMHHTSMYNRDRVGRNWVMRGYHDNHDDICFGAVMELLRNAPEEEGLVDDKVLAERLVWYYNEFDKHSKPPSTREIKREFVKNGDKSEPDQYWEAVVRNSKKFIEVSVSGYPRNILASTVIEHET